MKINHADTYEYKLLYNTVHLEWNCGMANLNQQLDTVHYLLNQLYFRVAETVSIGDVEDAISTGCVHSTWKEKRERGRGREEGSNRGEGKKGRRLREEDFM